MESQCKKCIGKWICAGEHLANGRECKKFHSVLESKLHSHNTTKATISLDIVRTVLEKGKCFMTIGVDTLIHEMEKIAKQ
ncbi:MAG TPA: hypothetical protein VMX17_01745 [Candidatus Glassbacteria bacterium]|nr:hypothetical protein [Candidatus Glassbacteria bacterium]